MRVFRNLDPATKFNLWMAAALMFLMLGVVVGIWEKPRWAVGPLIGLALICCVGMINNAVAEGVRERARRPAAAGGHQTSAAINEAKPSEEEAQEETTVAPS